MMKKLIVLATVLICARGAQATETVTVQLIDNAPTGSQVEILNDNEDSTPYSGWSYQSSNPVSEHQPGQIFMPVRDFTMTGFCFQLSYKELSLWKIEDRKFKVTINQHTDSCDVEPDTVLRTYYGTFPYGMSPPHTHKWLRFDFSVGVDLKANNYYSFLIEFTEPFSSQFVGFATSPINEGDSDNRLGIMRKDGVLYKLEKENLNMEFAILGEADLSRFDRISDAEIAENPDQILEKAYEKLQKFDNWLTDEAVKTKYADEIADALLIIARAKEAKSLPIEEVQNSYYDLIKQFPDSPKTATALCKLIAIDETSGWEYSKGFLAQDPAGNRTTTFCTALIKNHLTKMDYENVEKCIKFFFDKYQANKDGPKLIAKLLDNIGQAKNRERLDTIIEQAASKNPDSQMSCAAFRQRALTLSRTRNSDKLLEYSRLTCGKFPQTKLAECATAVLADNEYQQGNFVRALLAFKPLLFAEEKTESNIVKDIDDVLLLYQLNTLRTQGIDSGKVYEALAKYNQNLGRNTVAVHCYKKSADAKGLTLEVFESAASKDIKHSNAAADDEIWFWKGLFAAEQSDLIAASIAYKHFLKADSNSILSAKAYYDLALAKMALSKNSEAKDAITKAKHISPCEPVIKLERDLEPKLQ